MQPYVSVSFLVFLLTPLYLYPGRLSVLHLLSVINFILRYLSSYVYIFVHVFEQCLRMYLRYHAVYV